MFTYLDSHPNMKFAVVAVLILAMVTVVIGAWLQRERRRPDDYDGWQTDPADLSGQPYSMPAPLAGEHHPTPDEWEQLDPDVAADVWVAELHDDLPGPADGDPGNPPRSLVGGLVGELDFDAFLTDCLNDLTLLAWDARIQAERCRVIVEVGFPRLRAELGIAA